MTAVEWFNQQLVDRQNGNGDSRSRDEIFEQAKEIESEQRGYTESDMRNYASYILNHPVIEPSQWFKIYGKPNKSE